MRRKLILLLCVLAGTRSIALPAPSIRATLANPHFHGVLVCGHGSRDLEAIREFEELLRRNPHDNQGMRYLIGGLYHLSGNLSKAISHYKKAGTSWFGQRDPETEFNYGLALLQTRKYDAAILQFRGSFLINHYLPEIVLFRTVKPLDI